MAGGFHIPSFMVEGQKSGRELLTWVCDIWGGEPDRRAAQVKLAGWLMGDPTARPRQLELELQHRIGLSELLSGKSHPAGIGARIIERVTGGAVPAGDWEWTGPRCAPPPPPLRNAALDEMRLSDDLDPAKVARVRGTLGQTEGGPLFSCDRVAPNRLLLASSMGWTVGLDRAAATAMFEVLAGALGVTLPERRA